MEKQEVRNRILNINTELYNKGYTDKDIESFWNDCLNEVRQNKMAEDLDHAKSIHGEGYTYEHRKGTAVDLSKLKNNQKVCASKIKGHHILLTETNTNP